MEKTQKSGVLRKIVKLLGFLVLGFSVFVFGVLFFNELAISTGGGGAFITALITYTAFLDGLKATPFGHGMFLLALLAGGLLFTAWGVSRSVGKRVFFTIVLGLTVGAVIYMTWSIPGVHTFTPFQIYQVVMIQILLGTTWLEKFVGYGVLALSFMTLIGFWTCLKGRGASPKPATIVIRFFGMICTLLTVIIFLLYAVVFTILHAASLASWFSALPSTVTDIIDKVFDIANQVVIYGALASCGTLTLGNLLGVIFFWVR